MISTQTLKGNLVLQDYTTAFTLNQGDKGVPFKIELIDNGTPYTLLSTDTVYIEWLKPNGSPFLQEGNIKYGTNYIEITTPESIAQYSGSGTFNIIISDGTVRKGTIRREYKVIPTSMKPGSVSEDVITDAITELRELNSEITETLKGGSLSDYAKKVDVETEVNAINASLEEKANSNEVIRKGYGTLNDFDEETRRVIQGMDSGQINAVLGDGNVSLYNFNNSIKNKITTYIDITEVLNEGKMCNSGGTSIVLSDNENYNCIVFSVSTGDMINCSGAVDRTSAYQITFTNDDGLIIEKYNNASTTTFFENKTYVTPSGATKAYFNYHKKNVINVKNTYLKKLDMININTELSSLTEKTDNLTTNTSNNTSKIDNILKKGYVDLFPVTWELGYIKSDGTIDSNNITAHTSSAIMVKNGDKIICDSDNITLDILDSSNTIVATLESKGEEYIANGEITININFKYTDLSTITDLKAINNYVIGKSVIPIESTEYTPYKDKTILWLGTSIPAGYNKIVNGHVNSYPLMIGDLLGATVINNSVGGSMVSSGTLNSFCNTFAEKQAMEGWSTATAEQQQKYKSSCYDIALDPYIDGTNEFPDLIVIDYGYNDWSVTPNSNMPTDVYDKSTLIGGLNWIIKRILTANPHARICMIGHYTTNQITNSVKEKAKIITECQEKVAELWGIPLFRTWEHMGWSPMKITTTGYWDSDSTSNTYKQWVKSGGNEQEISILGTYLYDGLHPHSDYSGKALNLYRDVLYPFIRDIR